jgi:hypothetical protein
LLAGPDVAPLDPEDIFATVNALLKPCTRLVLLLLPLLAGPDVAPLSSSPLDPEGIFAIVNALRPVQGLGGSGKVLLAFAPRACREYYEVLTIRCAQTCCWSACAGLQQHAQLQRV